MSLTGMTMLSSATQSICQIPQASSQNSVAHRSEIVPILWLTAAFRLWVNWALSSQETLRLALRWIMLPTCRKVLRSPVQFFLWYSQCVISNIYVIKPKIVLIAGHFSTIAKFRRNIKFHKNGQILWLGSKFRGKLWALIIINNILCLAHLNTSPS